MSLCIGDCCCLTVKYEVCMLKSKKTNFCRISRALGASHETGVCSLALVITRPSEDCAVLWALELGVDKLGANAD